MARSQLAVVIPCHNEASTIGEVVSGALAHADVIVVDDRSLDDSPAIARTLGARVIAAASAGYDGALETGLRAAWSDGYSHVITMDADGEHDPAAITAFRRAFENGADLVCGYRDKPQRVAEYFVATVGYVLFRVRDLLCGMKGYSRSVLGLYFDSSLALSINMTPALLWLQRGGPHTEIAVTGRRRIGAPRFARALRANLMVLSAFSRSLARTHRKSKPLSMEAVSH